MGVDVIDVGAEVNKYLSLQNWREDNFWERKRLILIKTLFVVFNQMVVLAAIDEGVYLFISELNRIIVEESNKKLLQNTAIKHRTSIIEALDNIQKGKKINPELKKKINYLLNLFISRVSEQEKSLISINNFKKVIYFTIVSKLEKVNKSFFEQILRFADSLKQSQIIKNHNQTLVSFWKSIINVLNHKINLKIPIVHNDFSFIWSEIEKTGRKNPKSFKINSDYFISVFVKSISDNYSRDRVFDFCSGPFSFFVAFEQIKLYKNKIHNSNNITQRKNVYKSNNIKKISSFKNSIFRKTKFLKTQKIKLKPLFNGLDLDVVELIDFFKKDNLSREIIVKIPTQKDCNNNKEELKNILDKQQQIQTINTIKPTFSINSVEKEGSEHRSKTKTDKQNWVDEINFKLLRGIILGFTKTEFQKIEIEFLERIELVKSCVKKEEICEITLNQELVEHKNQILILEEEIELKNSELIITTSKLNCLDNKDCGLETVQVDCIKVIQEVKPIIFESYYQPELSLDNKSLNSRNQKKKEADLKKKETNFSEKKFSKTVLLIVSSIIMCLILFVFFVLIKVFSLNKTSGVVIKKKIRTL